MYNVRKNYFKDEIQWFSKRKLLIMAIRILEVEIKNGKMKFFQNFDRDLIEI